jgi:hypothetical protein
MIDIHRKNQGKLTGKITRLSASSQVTYSSFLLAIGLKDKINIITTMLSAMQTRKAD